MTGKIHYVTGARLSDQVFTITLMTGETVTWNVTKLNAGARAGLFGAVRYAATSDLPPARWDSWDATDRATVDWIKTHPTVLDEPAIAIAAPPEVDFAICCFADGQHRITARQELGLPEIAFWLVSVELERQFRIVGLTMIDLAEDVPGLPNFLNRNHGNCTMKPGPRELALRKARTTVTLPEAASLRQSFTIMNDSGGPITVEPPSTQTITERTNFPVSPGGTTDSKRVDNPPAKPANQENVMISINANVATPKSKAPPKAAPKAKKAASAKPAKAKAAKPAAKKDAPAPASGRPDGLKEGTQLAKLLDAAVAAGPEGVTEKALCAKLGWKACAVTLRRVCERVGAKCERKDDKFVVTLKKAA